MWQARPSPAMVLAAWLEPRVVGLILACAGLIGAIAVGVVVFVWMERKWRGAAETKAAPAQDESFYRALVEAGLLQEEEFERIRKGLEQKPAAAPPAPLSLKADAPPGEAS